MVDARAAWLHERGIRRRDPVAVWATAAADIVLSFLALTRLGAIPALMNGKMAPEIAAEYIRRLRARGVLADAAHAELLAGHDLDAPGFGMRTELLGEPAELGTGDPAAAPPRVPPPPGRPGRRSRTRPARPACRRPCCTRTARCSPPPGTC